MKTVKELPPTTFGRPLKYPYDKWLDGRINMLSKGDDFHVDVKSITNIIRYFCRHRDIGVTISQRGDDVYVQAHPKGKQPKKVR